MEQETWHSIWERKGVSGSRKTAYSQEELFAANGYDTPLGRTTEAIRERMLGKVVEVLAPGPGVSLLDAGCGSGAFLSMLGGTGAALSGADFSESLVAIARKALPGLDIRVAEAAKLPFAEGSFDAVLSHGVFLYFPNAEYATRALLEMIRVTRGAARLFISDIPDLAKKEQCLAARRAAGASVVPEHLYLAKEFFEDFASEHSLRVRIWDQDVPDYENTPYRFNVWFGKN
ncbi:MAG TPA: class I SAM-dependent methyltransferase [Bryobacteraceae bacterium]|jgi:SAM-dependent methyltransferase